MRVESLEKELEKSAAAKAEAERRSIEAQTKLDVLSNYFKDRELQLQKWATALSLRGNSSLRVPV